MGQNILSGLIVPSSGGAQFGGVTVNTQFQNFGTINGNVNTGVMNGGSQNINYNSGGQSNGFDIQARDHKIPDGFSLTPVELV